VSEPKKPETPKPTRSLPDGPYAIVVDAKRQKADGDEPSDGGVSRGEETI
jgi:hypothetical protein